MIITNSNAGYCHVNTKVQSTDLVQMKNMNFRVTIFRTYCKSCRYLGFSKRFTSFRGKVLGPPSEILTRRAPLLECETMAECDRWAPFFWVWTCSWHTTFLRKVVQFVKGYNSALYRAQTPRVSMCSIRSPCRIGYFYFTPNAACARHESLCRKSTEM